MNEADACTGVEPTARRVMLGVIAGAVVLASMMMALAGLAVGLGWISVRATGPVNLEPWLLLEIIGGAAASVIAGAVVKRVSWSRQGPAWLAATLLSIGLLESAEIVRAARAGVVVAPVLLLIIAPLVAPAGVLLGGWRRSRNGTALIARWRHSVTDVLRYSGPAVVLIVAGAVSAWGLPQLPLGNESHVVAAALALDFTVVAPGLVFMQFVRTKRAPWIVIVPTFAAGYALAAATMPESYQSVLGVIRILAVPAELAVVVYLIVLTRKALKSAAAATGDAVTRFRTNARRVIGSRIPADIITTEAMLLYYAFRVGRPGLPPMHRFTMHREAAYSFVLIGLGMVLIVETIALHLLVRTWSTAAAFVLTGLSVYGLIWLVGDYRAIVARPTLLSRDELSVRLGLRWQVDIPLACISGVEILKGAPARDGDMLQIALLGEPNLRVKLTRPIEATGMYGLRRRVRELRLRVDGAKELRAALLDRDSDSVIDLML